MICLKFTLIILTIAAADEKFLSSDSIFDQIAEAIDNLKGLIQDAVNKALEALNNLFLELLKLPFKLLEEATKKLIQLIGKAKDDIAKLLEKAQEVGVDASECVKHSDSSLVAAMTETIAQLTECVTDKLCEAKDLIKTSIQDIKKYIEIVDGIQEKIKDCGTGLTAVKCLTGVLADIVKLSTTLPLEIAKQVKHITELAKTVQSAMVKCEADALIKATAEIGGMVLEVAKCVTEKIKANEETYFMK